MPYQPPTRVLLMKRIIDLIFGGLGLIILSPFFIFIAIGIKLDSRGPVFFKQWRVGKNDKDFLLWKFRTMVSNAQKGGLITVGGRDARVTAIGYYLRKFKLDEVPQLINVAKGDMALVGPRPEVRYYVNLYNADQRTILAVKPGLTDFASLKFADENELLENVKDPESYYSNEILPEKIELGHYYIRKMSVKTDFKIMFRTLLSLVR